MPVTVVAAGATVTPTAARTGHARKLRDQGMAGSHEGRWLQTREGFHWRNYTAECREHGRHPFWAGCTGGRREADMDVVIARFTQDVWPGNFFCSISVDSNVARVHARFGHHA
jgi:hypothetical protein